MSSKTIRSDADADLVYESMTHHEHVLHRPDSYVGGTQPVLVEDVLTTMPTSSDEKWGLERTTIKKYVPALFKIFDEVIVNAADHWSTTCNSRRKSDRMTKLDITITAEKAIITNDGRGIPIRRLPEHNNMYVVELIFGTLLTSSNYRDDKEKVTGGRNGYGSKCTNIYSKEFTIETCDGKKVYSQTWRNNMYEVSKPVIRKARKGESQYTTVAFCPDFARLGGVTFDSPRIMDLLRRRAMDTAAWCRGKVAVTFNGDNMSLPGGLTGYARAYVGNDRPMTVFKTKDGRWEVVVTYGDSGTFEHISFVNGISTIRGGRHVEYVAKQLTKALVSTIGKRAKTRVTTKAVRSQMLLLVRAVIINPAFDGQVKEMLTTPVAKFGSKCVLPKTFVDKVLKTVPTLVDRIVAHAEYRNNRALKRTDGVKTTSLRGIPKLNDATKAGGRASKKCTLILTEGDSAMAMAISGLSVVPNGRDWFGVLPLKGKPLNARSASATKIAANTEITNIKRTLGLKVGGSYSHSDKPWKLRYGSILVMTDQDVDGSHIKGLLANLFATHWPSLLRIGFMKALVTPVIKAFPTRKSGQEYFFYNTSDYEKWCSKRPNYTKTHRIKYYKGLGTSSTSEAKEYFGEHRRDVLYKWSPVCGEALSLTFDKSRSDDRKDWIRKYDSSQVLDANLKEVSFSELVNTELRIFSYYNLGRAIPSVMDGLKPSQRKVLFSCFKRGLKKEIRVSQLAGYVSEHASYHHGEASLHGTIINMAQVFVGSNNLELLAPHGQYGTRLQGGSDAASPRYIFTCLAELTELLFPQADLPLLEYLNDGGQSIEPTYYQPIAPLVLMNGAKGIGTGWSTDIPMHHPCHVISCVREWIAQDISGDEAPRVTILEPWFRHFDGIVERIDENSFLTRGSCQKESDTKVRVTELPIGMWNISYKAFLEKVIASGKIGLLEYEDRSTESKVDFLLIFDRARLDSHRPCTKPAQFHKIIGITSRNQCNYRNMNMFDPDGKIHRYTSANEIIDAFCPVRKKMYEQRYSRQLEDLATKATDLLEKLRFVEEVVNGGIDIAGRRPQSELESELQVKGFNPNIGGPPLTGSGRYNHLLKMHILDLTQERADDLRRRHKAAVEAHAKMAATTPMAIWLEELSALEAAYIRLSI